MMTAESRRPWAYDFQICGEISDLKRAIAAINDNGYELVCVAPYTIGTFVVFFRRPVHG